MAHVQNPKVRSELNLSFKGTTKLRNIKRVMDMSESKSMVVENIIFQKMGTIAAKVSDHL